MHSLEKVWSSFQEVYQEWYSSLESYSELDLWRDNPNGGWNLGQVYQHIINGTLKFQAIVIRELLETQEDAHQSKSPIGEIAYRDMAFPPRKFQVHRETANEPEMTNKITLRNQMKRVYRAVEELKELLADDPPSGKFEHQIFGYLSAREWYQNIPMHWRHHLRQKEELDAIAV